MTKRKKLILNGARLKCQLCYLSVNITFRNKSHELVGGVARAIDPAHDDVLAQLDLELNRIDLVVHTHDEGPVVLVKLNDQPLYSFVKKGRSFINTFY